MNRLIAIALLLAGVAHADVLTFPGCAGTLQGCLDKANAGDTVQIAADTQTAETLVAKRSLTLEGAPGTVPALKFGTTLTVTPEGDAPASFTVRNLEFRGGWIEAFHERAADLAVTITGNRFVHGGPQTIIHVGEPVKVPNDPYGALTTTIADNTLVADDADTSNGILVNANYSTRLSASIRNNALEIVGTARFGVAVQSTAPTADVDVIGNRIAGEDYESGVTIYQSGGSLAARVVGNVVTGQHDVVGALQVFGEDGHAEVLVANNTVAGNANGLSVQSESSDPIQGVVANNIVADNELGGLVVGASITIRNNLVFANGIDAFVPDAATKIADPLFVPGTFRLQPGSPAHDAGATDVVPADVTTDADGNPRIAGAAVDIGAFEIPCPECQPDGPPASCDDGDPCTVDAAEGVSCTHAPATGVAALSCTCARASAAACAGRELPDGVRRKTARACSLVASTDARKAIRRATRQWSGALRAARAKSTRRRVGAECADAIAAGLGDAVARARAFLTAP